MRGVCSGCRGFGELDRLGLCGACVAAEQGQESLLSLLEGEGQARASDPPTAKAAAASPWVRWRAGTARRELLLAHGRAQAAGWPESKGLTDEEAAEIAALSLRSEYATRCSELRRLGLLAETGEQRRSSSGLDRAVSRLTPLGFRALAELEGPEG